MASFYAELHLAGAVYCVVQCQFACQQATDTRGRVQAKVHFAPLHLVVDVPEDDTLLAWAAAPHKPLAGEVVFYDTAQRTAHETIAFAAGECVHYGEQFASSATGNGAYVCQLVITAASFELRAGGPAGSGTGPAADAAGYASGAGALAAVASLPLGGDTVPTDPGGVATPEKSVLTPRALALAVNSSKGTMNCTQIAEAVIHRMHGTDPEAVAPDVGTRTLREVEKVYNTTFAPLADFQTAFDIIKNSAPGTTGLIAMGPRVVTPTAIGHMVAIVNHQGKATIIEGQNWGGYDQVEAISTPSRAVRRYGDPETTELAFTIVPPPAAPA